MVNNFYFHVVGFPFHSGNSLGNVSSSQRTKGDKKTPAITCFVITGAKVGGIMSRFEKLK